MKETHNFPNNETIKDVKKKKRECSSYDEILHTHHYSHNNILLKNRYTAKNVKNSNYIQLLKICQHKNVKINSSYITANDKVLSVFWLNNIE